MLKVGVLKEIKQFEGRVMLTPEAVKVLTRNGIEVVVENGAGEACRFDDIQYERAGALILPTMEKVMDQARLLLQVQPPQPIEYELLNQDHTLISFMNIVQKPERMKALLETKATYVSVELLQDTNGRYPILMGMSAIAGRMAIYQAAQLLTIPAGGKGKLLSGAEIVKPANITILGAGMVGRTAAKQALDNGANVNLLSLKEEKVQDLKRAYPRARIDVFDYDRLRELLPQSDVFIVAVYSLKKTYDIFIDKETIALMSEGSVVIDMSVEQAQIVETSHVTSHDQSSYIIDGIVHYCVPNVASIVPQTSSRIIAKRILPFVKHLAKKGLKESLDEEPGLVPALTIYKGKITNRKMADLHNMEFYNIYELMELNL